MLLIHSISVIAFILFIFSLLCVQYTYSGFVTKLTSSAVTQVFDLEKCSISKTLLRVFKRENNLLQLLFSDAQISARLLRSSHNPRLSGLGFNTTLVF